jgi:hypothetical protein
VSVQDRCMVCAKHTIGSEIILDALNSTQVTRLKWKLVSFHSETMLMSVQDRCMLGTERTTGSKIVLDAHNGTAR